MALIDAGNDAEIVPLLQQFGITAIDLIVASHLDFDHIGGIDEVLQAFPVSYYMANSQSHNSAEYRWLMRLLQQSDIGYVAPVAQTIELGSVTLQVLPPPGWGRSSKSPANG